MHREFEVTAPDVRLMMVVPIMMLLVGGVGIAIAAASHAQVGWLILVLLLIVTLTILPAQRRRVELVDRTLSIAASLHTHRIDVGDLDLDQARVVDLGQHRKLRTMLTTWGTWIPGFQAGHYLLRDRSRAFLLLTDRKRVLLILERNGRKLLLSLEKPQALLDALRDVAQISHRR
jgi:uncharacterized membrane protein YtjA (UPF0391 family)